MVLEKRDIVGGGLDSYDQPELIVHLDGGSTHVMAYTRALDTCAEVVAKFVLIIACQLASEESGHIVGFDGVDGRAGDRFVNGSEV